MLWGKYDHYCVSLFHVETWDFSILYLYSNLS